MSVLLNPTPIQLKFKVLTRMFNHFVKLPSNHFYRLKASKHYDELTLQRIFKYKIDALLPNHSSIYYNKTIVSSLNNKDRCKPDFLIWKKDYSEWYIVEVEMENHEISHIDKQLRTFYNGDYSDVESISQYVKKKKPSLNKSDFKNLISKKRPKLLLISDIIHCEWETKFTSYDCAFSTLQVYGDRDDHFMYRISGDFPQEYSQFTYCTFNSSKFSDGNVIDIYYNGNIYQWQLIISEDIAQIIFIEDFLPMDLTPKKWKIIINYKGEYHLIK